MGATTDFVRPSGAREFLTRESSPSLFFAAPGLAIGLGIGFCLPLDPQTQVLVGGGLGLVLCATIIALLLRLFPGKKTSVVVGVDGVLVWSQFVPYCDIKGVCLEGRRVPAGQPGTMTMSPQEDDEYVWRLSLDRVSSTPLFVADLRYDARAPVERADVRGAPLVKAIEQAHAAWTSARESPEVVHEDLVSRGEASGSRWLDMLRGLGSGANSTYRVQAASQRALSRLLVNPRARPSARAAAAIVLAESGDPTSRRKLRMAAESMAHPRLRVALMRVAEETTTDALVDALDALEAAECNTWKRTSAQQRHSP